MSKGGGLASMTFDDGPDGLWTARVLDALLASEVRATFFVTGPLAREHPALVERMRDEGHEVALHCSRHVRHTGLGEEEIEADAVSGLGDLRALGISARRWRPPWGIVTGSTRRVARRLGLEISLWNADTHDWRGDPAERMLAAVSPSLRDGSVVLMHDGLGPGARRTGCHQTVALVPALADRLRDLGCEPVPMSELARRGSCAEVAP